MLPTIILDAFIDKLPMFDPAWPDELREAWLKIAGELLSQKCRQICCDIPSAKPHPA